MTGGEKVQDGIELKTTACPICCGELLREVNQWCCPDCKTVIAETELRQGQRRKKFPKPDKNS